MLTAGLLAFALAPRPLPVVHGDLAAPAAWASVHEQQLYVCWQQATGCFEAVDLSQALAGAPTEVAFVGPDALVVSDGHSAIVVDPRGDQRLVEGPAVPTRRPTVLRCSPTGALPYGAPGEAVWLDAPCTGPLCPGPTPLAQPPRFAAELSLGVEVIAGNWTRDRWARPVRLEGSGYGQDVTALLTLTVTLPSAIPPRRDPPKPAVRRLPRLIEDGPVELQHAAEQAARNIVCPEVSAP